MSPLKWSERGKVVATPAVSNASFGGSVALSGDSALVGANTAKNDGKRSSAAYFFVRNASLWTQQQQFAASDSIVRHLFGFAVALSSEAALVGDSQGDAAGSSSGSAYVFMRSANSWVEQPTLAANDVAEGDYFGTSVALSGVTALVGASGDDDAGSSSGSAYVFMRSASSWSQQGKLVADDAAAGDAFGSSVALSGGTACVGAPDGGIGGLSSGAAYAFTRSASSWTQQGMLLANDGAAGDEFGSSVALSGDTALVGAPSGGDGAGSAYIFTRSASSWTQQGKLLANDAVAGDGFGGSVALSGDTALVGAQFDDGDVTGSFSGAAYAFARTADSWTQQTKLVASDGSAGDVFGSSVALSGDTALVGARRDDGGATYSSGSAYIFGLRLVDGENCADASSCGSAYCADGFCCDALCDGPCQACNEGTLEGICSLRSRGSAPSSDCQGYLCDGSSEQCPKRCGADADCAGEYYCEKAVVCLPQVADGQRCVRDAGCLSGHCVDGICCAEACGEGCGSCTVVGLEGMCTPLPEGHSGAPQCAPYRCAGNGVGCPASCAAHHECAPENHCVAGRCQPNTPLAAVCTDDAACASAHCSDGVCCVVASCGAYRCGAAGSCEDACSSSAQCANGYACSSNEKCEARSAASVGDSGACSVGGVAPLGDRVLLWLSALGLLGCSSAMRRCRRSRRRRAQSSRC